jgi:hypothetical protein
MWCKCGLLPSSLARQSSVGCVCVCVFHRVGEKSLYRCEDGNKASSFSDFVCCREASGNVIMVGAVRLSLEGRLLWKYNPVKCVKSVYFRVGVRCVSQTCIAVRSFFGTEFIRHTNVLRNDDPCTFHQTMSSKGMGRIPARRGFETAPSGRSHFLLYFIVCSLCLGFCPFYRVPEHDSSRRLQAFYAIKLPYSGIR